MNILKKVHIFLGMACVFSVLTFFTGCSNRDNNHSRPKLKVGMECAYAPFNWIQPFSKGNAAQISGGWYACGYDVYISRRIAEILNLDLEIVKVDWDGLLPALTSGKIDAIVAGMSATENRRRAIDFTESYYTSNVVVVLKKGSIFQNAKSINDFKGAKITGQLGTLPYSFIDQMSGVSKQVAMEDFSSIISSLSAGKIDCYVSEKAAALTAVHTNPDLMYIEFEDGKGFNFSEDQIAVRIGVKKGDSLKEKINEALENISESERKNMMDYAVEMSCSM